MAWVVARKGPQGDQVQGVLPRSERRRAISRHLPPRAEWPSGQVSVKSSEFGRAAGMTTHSAPSHFAITWKRRGCRASTSSSRRALPTTPPGKHFFPFFGDRPMGRILPSNVQEWVTMATAQGLAPRSVRKYHVMLHSIFRRAVRDQLILTNPCEHTELPKVVLRRSRTFDA